MTYPNDPMFQATMPNDYGSPTNFGAYGANPNAQGWGVNSNYLTPSFLAPYRPQYSGNPNFQMPGMNFLQASRMSTPFAPPVPYYSDPQMMKAQASRELASKVGDMPMAGAQVVGSVAIGLATMAAVDSIRFQGLGGSQADVRGFAQGFRNFMPTWLGGAATASEAAYLARSQTLMEAGGRYAGHAAGWMAGKGVSGTLQAGSMLLRGKGISNLPNIAGAVARAGAITGAVAGSLLAPFALMEAASQTADKLIFSPYVSGRQNSDMIQDSLRGTYTGYGSAASPLSMTNVEANRRGFEMSRSMVEGNAFGMRAGADIYNNASSMGLFKGTGFGQGEMKKRMKEVTESVSLIMSVFNDPSTQEAISRLAQLSHGSGLKTLSDTSQLAQKYRVASAVTGVGTRELMSGIGSQGQMMYAQSGLMPHLGQYAALNAISGLTAGYRAGLISSPSLAMMGGLEGAAQKSMEAQLGLASTTYFSMSAHNRANGYNGSSIVGNVSRFGQSMANNPVRSLGGYLLNKDVNVSSALRDNPRSVLDQIFELAKNRPGSYNKDGQLYAEALTLIANENGIDPARMRALIGEIEGTAAYDKTGARAAAFEQTRASMFNNSGAYYLSESGPGAWLYSAMRGGKEIQSAMSSNVMQPIANLPARLGDALTNANFKASAAFAKDAGLASAEGVSGADWATSSGKTRKYSPEKYIAMTGKNGGHSTSSHVSSTLMALGGTAMVGLAMTVGMPATLLGGAATAGMYALGGMTYAAGVGQLFDSSAGKDRLQQGPDDATKTLLTTFDVLSKKDPSLLIGIDSPTPSKLAQIAKSLGVSIDTATEVVNWYNSSFEVSGGSQSLMGSYLESTSLSMSRALAGSNDGWNWGYGTNVKGSMDSLTQDEKITLLGFGKVNRDALSSVEGFLMAVEYNPAVKGILSKMGYAGMFGTGPEAMSIAQDALKAITAVTAAGSISNPQQSVIETAAAMATGKGGLKKLLTAKDLEKHMSSAHKGVRSTNPKYQDAFAAGKLATDSRLNVLSTAQAQDSSIRSRLLSVGDVDGKIDKTGMLQASANIESASTKLSEAADNLNTAARRMGMTRGEKLIDSLTSRAPRSESGRD